MHAYILIRVDAGREKMVIHSLSRSRSVEWVHEIYGDWDLISYVSFSDFATLDYVASNVIRSVRGVERTQTYIVAGEDALEPSNYAWTPVLKVGGLHSDDTFNVPVRQDSPTGTAVGEPVHALNLVLPDIGDMPAVAQGWGLCVPAAMVDSLASAAVCADNGGITIAVSVSSIKKSIKKDFWRVMLPVSWRKLLLKPGIETPELTVHIGGLDWRKNITVLGQVTRDASTIQLPKFMRSLPNFQGPVKMEVLWIGPEETFEDTEGRKGRPKTSMDPTWKEISEDEFTHAVDITRNLDLRANLSEYKLTHLSRPDGKRIDSHEVNDLVLCSGRYLLMRITPDYDIEPESE